jgi:hypothetical protein
MKRRVRNFTAQQFREAETKLARETVVEKGAPVLTQWVTPNDRGVKLRYGSIAYQRFYAGDHTDELEKPKRLTRGLALYAPAI